MSVSTAPVVLVLGGRGRLGLAAVQAFARAGWRVLAQIRPGATAPPAAAACSGVQWLQLAPGDTDALAAHAAAAQVVVHALNPPYTHRAWRQQAPALMAAAIAITQRLGASLLLPGNVYNFGHTMPKVLTEETPQTATTVKGQLRIGLEQQLAQASQAGSMRAVVLRAGDFFGAGKGTWLDQLIAAKLRRGRFSYPGPLDVPTAWAYLPDLAETLVRVAAQRDQLPRWSVLHFAGHTLTGEQWRQALTTLAQQQGWWPAHRALRCSTLPWPLLRSLAWLVPSWQALLEMRYLWHTPHRLENARLTALIGPEPHTPLLTALQQTLAV